MRLKRAKALDQIGAQEFEGRRRKVKRRKRREQARQREPRRELLEEEDEDSLFDLVEELLDDGLEGVRRRRPAGDSVWNTPSRVGRHLCIQAAVGYRAAVIELRPGLFLVAEMPERVASPDFGVVPFLAPLMLKAAKRAIDPVTPKSSGVASLFRREEPRQITGPVDVGWADAAEVAEVIGGDAYDRRRS